MHQILHLYSGTAPSQELLDTWNARECGLIAEHAGAVPPVAFAPEPIGAYVGQDLSNDVRDKIAREGARTIPGREHGGNCDVCVYHILLYFK
jgi:formamidase